ncbi:MAG: hypothetical protein JWQ90_2976 [Hydrocarboniphaga sp.]|uniref:ketosteroid isomerase-related protein n=1 Tax=Hydrocarboniphaga sp. TaxID=2033016 RepID=UPI00262559A0|nr:ketosteroid isomerase-related protein [Hydrocarboniphaga sp.]MDB5970526.1 hypothetical protein [Hydrocarboniphaga sp.]
MNEPSRKLLETYYARFNALDWDGFLELLTDDVVHDINQSGREIGREAFREFLERMDRSYSEQIVDLSITTNADGSRAAVEFTVLGVYKNTDEGLPPATGQTYKLPAGAFFEIRDGRVARISNYYNLQDWLKQVGA